MFMHAPFCHMGKHQLSVTQLSGRGSREQNSQSCSWPGNPILQGTLHAEKTIRASQFGSILFAQRFFFFFFSIKDKPTQGRLRTDGFCRDTPWTGDKTQIHQRLEVGTVMLSENLSASLPGPVSQYMVPCLRSTAQCSFLALKHAVIDSLRKY